MASASRKEPILKGRIASMHEVQKCSQQAARPLFNVVQSLLEGVHIYCSQLGLNAIATRSLSLMDIILRGCLEVASSTCPKAVVASKQVYGTASGRRSRFPQPMF